MTVASNQFQNHNQLLRHGMLNWVTRGVFLGYQRNYLELARRRPLPRRRRVGPGDATRPSYDPARASRMTPADVDRAIAWSRARGLRLDMVYNGGGSALYGGDGAPIRSRPSSPTRPCATRSAGSTTRYEHPNLDCSTTAFITQPDHAATVAWARDHAARRVANAGRARHGRALRPGQHPAGQPRHDRPAGVRRRRAAGGGGTLPAGTYDYAHDGALGRAARPRRRSQPGVAVGAAGSRRASASRRLPRGRLRRLPAPGRDGAWARWRRSPRTADAADRRRHASRSTLTHHRHRRGRAPRRTPPAANGAALAPVRPEPGLRRRRSTQRRHPRRSPPTPRRAIRARRRRAPSPLAARRARRSTQGAVARGPALPEQRLLQRLAPGPAARRVQLDLRRARRRRRLRPDRRRDDLPHRRRRPGREYVDQRDADHVPPPDGQRPAAALLPPEQPRRLQPGAAGHRPRPGGILYPVIDALLDRYEAAFDRASAPLVQLTHDADRATRSRSRTPGPRRAAARVARGCRTVAYTYATPARRRSTVPAHRDDRGRAPTAASAPAGSRSPPGATVDVRAAEPGQHRRARGHGHARGSARR